MPNGDYISNEEAAAFLTLNDYEIPDDLKAAADAISE
jgi:hypothetical protein